MTPPERADVGSQGAQDPHAIHRLNAMWMVRLRWAAIAGQAVTIFAVHGPMGITLPLGPLAVIIVVSALSNVVAAVWLRRGQPVTESALGAVMALDLCLFTGLLYFTGGPFNPFSSLYLVHLALAALVLSSRFTWSLVLLAVAANAALFLRHVPLPIDHGEHHDAAPAPMVDGEPMGAAEAAPAAAMRESHDQMPTGAHAGPKPMDADHTTPAPAVDPHGHGTPRTGHQIVPAGTHEPLGMHLQGMWVAFGVTAGFIVYFLNRVTRTLAERDAELARISERSARAARLASVATLAAGAAHELSTPLATIAVVAGELERSKATETQEDARLIRAQVERCRDILGQMAGDAGASPGEAPSAVPLGDLVEATLGPIEDRARIDMSWGEGTRPDTKVVVPLRAMSQALRNVILNGLEASGEGGHVTLELSSGAGAFTAQVADAGTGIASEYLDAVSDPFFTTKDAGRGMGLGLFLTRSVVDFLGGTLDIDSELGRGTRVTITIPLTRSATAAEVSV